MGTARAVFPGFRGCFLPGSSNLGAAGLWYPLGCEASALASFSVFHQHLLSSSFPVTQINIS